MYDEKKTTEEAYEANLTKEIKKSYARLFFFFGNKRIKKKEELEDMMQDWFRNAKLGIFIHYGIYAVGDVRVMVVPQRKYFL